MNSRKTSYHEDGGSPSVDKDSPPMSMSNPAHLVVRSGSGGHVQDLNSSYMSYDSQVMERAAAVGGREKSGIGRVDSLQDELSMECSMAMDHNNSNYALFGSSLGGNQKQSLDEEFFNSSTLRTQERYETNTEQDLYSVQEDGEEHIDPEALEGSGLRD